MIFPLERKFRQLGDTKATLRINIVVKIFWNSVFSILIILSHAFEVFFCNNLFSHNSYLWYFLHFSISQYFYLFWLSFLLISVFFFVVSLPFFFLFVCLFVSFFLSFFLCFLFFSFFLSKKKEEGRKRHMNNIYIFIYI